MQSPGPSSVISYLNGECRWSPTVFSSAPFLSPGNLLRLRPASIFFPNQTFPLPIELPDLCIFFTLYPYLFSLPVPQSPWRGPHPLSLL